MRNKDNRQLLVLFGILTLAGTAAGFLVSAKAGWLALILSVLFVMAALWIQKLRHDRIRELSLALDQLLHGDFNVNFGDYTEGELEILKNELTKVTITLKEQAEILQSEKVRLADSIADISHQIRTPLTALNLNLASLGTEECTGRERKEKILQAKLLTGRMEWLIEALLKLAKLDAGTISFAQDRITAAELIEKAAEPFEISMELREQTLDVSGVSKNCSFTGDFSWSVEAVSNVIKNCMEHTGKGGTIWISCSENAIYTEIVIADNGPGIEREDLPRLFERFYKGKNAGSQSIGIGLALTRAILAGENGTIQAENGRNGGAKFCIRIYKGIY